MKLLCISRKHPPSVGGMQLMNYELIRWLAQNTEATIFKWGHSQAFLPIFLLSTFLRALTLIRKSRRPDVIYLGDALLAPFGLLLKAILRRPAAITAHGRDLIFRFPLYRTVISFSIRRLDRVIAVSRHTASLCRECGVEKTRVVTIPNGIDCAKNSPASSDTESARRWLVENGRQGDQIILTVGRLVKRKGIVPFIGKILPLLIAEHPGLLYVIAGEGREKKRIEAEIRRRNLGGNVLLAGYLPRSTVRGLMGVAKVFVMPNVSVAGDAEGFGLVALEASCSGLPVVASDIEGIRDAVKSGENGFLVPPDRPEQFASEIGKLLGNEEGRKEAGERARRYTMRNYSWDNCARLYLEELRRITPGGSTPGV